MENAYINVKIRKTDEPGCSRGSLEALGDDGDILWLTFEILTMIAANQHLNMDALLLAFIKANERRKMDSKHQVICVDKSELQRQLESES